MAIPRSASQPTFGGGSPSGGRPKRDPGLVSIKFSPGYHGLRWEGTRVTNSVMQAWMGGVRPGWSINTVNGVEVNTTEEIAELLAIASEGKRRYEVRFQKGLGNFGTEAKERADQEKRNRLRLRKTFTFKGAIERTDHRGITLRQLEQVVAYAEEYCSRWHDPTPGKQFSGNLTIETMNHYHTNAWIVRPATEPKKCAFVELLSGQPQIPNWFLCHWHGDLIVDFMACIQQHMELRGLNGDSPYWIATYANRQHLPQDFGEDLKKTGFFKALETTNFKVLLLLDAQATAFTRTWCVFELIMCLDAVPAPLDIATCEGGCVELLTHGLTEEEEHLELQVPGAGVRAKAQREQTFPIELAEVGMAAQLRTTSASDDEDRAYILNMVAGLRLIGMPPVDHPKYEEADIRLAAFLAATLWTRAADVEERADKFAAALRRDEWRKALDMPIQGMDSGGFSTIMDSLPPNLEELKLHLNGSSIDDQDIDMFTRALPQGLKSLNLDLTHCRRITDTGVDILANAIDFDKMLIFFNLSHTSANKEKQEWYAQMAARNEAAGRDDQKVDVARALGVSICRDPDVVAQHPRKVVPAAQILARIVKEEDGGDGTFGNRAVLAYRALGRVGRRAQELLEKEAQDVLGAELARREAEKKAKEAAKRAKVLDG